MYTSKYNFPIFLLLNFFVIALIGLLWSLNGSAWGPYLQRYSLTSMLSQTLDRLAPYTYIYVNEAIIINNDHIWIDNNLYTTYHETESLCNLVKKKIGIGIHRFIRF